MNQKGVTLVETLVTITLLGILALGLMQAVNMTIFARGKNVRSNVAMELATSYLETLSSIDPETLTSANSNTTTVSKDNFSFTREVEVVVNANESRTITVTVTGDTVSLGGKATLTKTLSLWGTN